MSIRYHEGKASSMGLWLLESRVNYMMRHPTSYMIVNFFYDLWGEHAEDFPASVDTKGKLMVLVGDNRGVFSDKSGAPLVAEFKKHLEVIYWPLREVVTDMDGDIVAEFRSSEGVFLGYFYQGEYQLWKE